MRVDEVSAPGGEPLDSAPTPDQRDDFIQSHYRLIAEHATQLSRLRWTYVQLSLFGVAVFYSALFSADTTLGRSDALPGLLALPVALAFFGLRQAEAMRIAIKERNGVLLGIEKRYCFQGWAHSVDRRWNSPGQNPFDNLVRIYWIALLAFTTVAALIVTFNVLDIPNIGNNS